MSPASMRVRLGLCVVLSLALAGCDKAPDAPAAPAASAAPAVAAAPAASAAPASAAVASNASANAAAPASLDDSVKSVVDELAQGLGETETAAYEQQIEQIHDAPHGQLGLLAFLGQKLELATWLYGRGVQAEPDNDVYWNNFGLGLHEKALMGQPTDQRLLTLAVQSLTKAASLKPDNASYQSNLGFALLEQWRTSSDAATLQAAVDALKRATTLDAKSATAWAHLGEALAAQGDASGAQSAFAKSRAIEAFNGALLATGLRLPAAMQEAFRGSGEGSACNMDFQCKASCPHSIIGQINYVTCEEAQSSAQGACEAGRPYAEGFDCREQIPEFGILFPGLNSGFSVIFPWGRLDMTIDGQGNVDYKFKLGTSVGGVGTSVQAKGSWTPASGFSSVGLKPGVSYNLMGGDAAKYMSDMKMGPASMSFEVKPSLEGKFSIKAFGGTIFSH